MVYRVHATGLYSARHFELHLETRLYERQLSPAPFWLSLCQPCRKYVQPFGVILRPPLANLQFRQPIQPVRNTSSEHLSPPADRRRAETTAALAGHTATHNQNRKSPRTALPLPAGLVPDGAKP